MVNVGQKEPQFTTNGIQTSMTFQETSNVKKPLAAASRIIEKGSRIVLDGEGCDSYIEHKGSGKRIPLTIENGIYMMEMLVNSPSSFRRPAN